MSSSILACASRSKGSAEYSRILSCSRRARSCCCSSSTLVNLSAVIKTYRNAFYWKLLLQIIFCHSKHFFLCQRAIKDRISCTSTRGFIWRQHGWTLNVGAKSGNLLRWKRTAQSQSSLFCYPNTAMPVGHKQTQFSCAHSSVGRKKKRAVGAGGKKETVFKSKSCYWNSNSLFFCRKGCLQTTPKIWKKPPATDIRNTELSLKLLLWIVHVYFEEFPTDREVRFHCSEQDSPSTRAACKIYHVFHSAICWKISL